jgi:hypothetical protein
MPNDVDALEAFFAEATESPDAAQQRLAEAVGVLSHDETDQSIPLHQHTSQVNDTTKTVEATLRNHRERERRRRNKLIRQQAEEQSIVIESQDNTQHRVLKEKTVAQHHQGQHEMNKRDPNINTETNELEATRDDSYPALSSQNRSPVAGVPKKTHVTPQVQVPKLNLTAQISLDTRTDLVRQSLQEEVSRDESAAHL